MVKMSLVRVIDFEYAPPTSVGGEENPTPEAMLLRARMRRNKVGEYNGYEYVSGMSEYKGADQMRVSTGLYFYADNSPLKEGDSGEGEFLTFVYRTAGDRWEISDLSPNRTGASHSEVYSCGVHTNISKTAWARKPLHLLVQDVVIFAPPEGVAPDFSLDGIGFIFPKLVQQKMEFLKEKFRGMVSDEELSSDTIKDKFFPLGFFLQGWGMLFLVAGQRLGLWTVEGDRTETVGIRLTA